MPGWLHAGFDGLFVCDLVGVEQRVFTPDDGMLEVPLVPLSCLSAAVGLAPDDLRGFSKCIVARLSSCC